MTVAAHGGDIYQNQITYDFSVNTNPLPLPEILQKRMAEAAVHSNRYPQYDNVLLRERLAALYGFSTEEVVCGNGASELFVAIGSFFFGICLGGSDSRSRDMQYSVAGRK